ncbi:acetyl-CoA carboxylase carboxyl transferase subunit alpha [Aerococcaceae bacterium NML180378]|nr:acetyl-CoA carboxylase carboxyl transferase subunit alpha [Aerococcaceae bacterium NML180378]
MQAYQIVQRARDVHRISTQEIIQALCSNFIECHGDRIMADDKAIIGGVGLMDNQPTTIIGIQKGKTLKENLKRNFGSAGPAGYRKAQRLMKQAEKFRRPILTLINTAGASCTPKSEENGIGEAIASSLLLMSELTVPTIAIILGEGGSGGAIALAVADRVWMLENSIYAILSPEGFASILWKDAKLASKAADIMKLTARELLELSIIDEVIEEKETLLTDLTNKIKSTFRELTAIPVEERMEQKYQKFRKF